MHPLIGNLEKHGKGKVTKKSKGPVVLGLNNDVVNFFVCLCL